MSFLPKGFEAPKTQSNYLKPIEGIIKFRAIGDAIFGYEYWTNEKKPVRLKQAPAEKPADIKLEDNGSYSIKPFLAFPVIDRNDTTTPIKILEITQNSIMKDFEDYNLNEDWGDPKGYDITITGKGKGMERRYSTIASPHKALTKKEQSIVARTEINLGALFQGGDPFSEKVADMPEEEVDVPFN